MPKGSKAALWILAFNTGVWRGDVRTFLRVRRNAIDAIKSAAALRLFPCLCVLRQLRRKRWHSKNNQRFANLAVGWLRECKPFHRTAVGTKGWG